VTTGRVVVTIAVLCKWCPDPADLEVSADGSISLERAQWNIGEYDRVAIEVAMAVAGASGDGSAGASSVVAVTAGPPVAASSLARKAILSRGPETLFAIADQRLEDADTFQTASALAGAIRRLGDLQLVVCGAGSVDLYSQQVGIQVAEQLGWPVLDQVSSLVLDGSLCRAERSLDGRTDSFEVPLPLVVSVTAGAAEPRIPGMRDILSAGKRPTTEWSLDDVGASGPATPARSARVLATVARDRRSRRQIMLDGKPAESARQLVESLRRDGVL
jgi:electron transfer flavoprotein beta subunit